MRQEIYSLITSQIFFSAPATYLRGQMVMSVASDTKGRGFESYRNHKLYGFFGFKNKSLRETFPSFYFKTLLHLPIKAMKSLVEFIQV